MSSSYIQILEDARAKVEKAVEENFGYAPCGDESFVKLMEELSYAERVVKDDNPEYFKTYSEKWY